VLIAEMVPATEMKLRALVVKIVDVQKDIPVLTTSVKGMLIVEMVLAMEEKLLQIVV
jgi:hypothetical protein